MKGHGLYHSNLSLGLFVSVFKAVEARGQLYFAAFIGFMSEIAWIILPKWGA